MEDILFINIQCDYLVAQYALTKTNYVSVEAAADFIFGTDDTGTYQHPFVEYQPLVQDFGDDEMGVCPPQCFICQDGKAQHPTIERRQNLDEEEAKLIEELLSYENTSGIQSSHVSGRKSFVNDLLQKKISQNAENFSFV